MLDQIKQVGLTYVTQRYLWWGLAFFSLTALPSLLLAVFSKGHNPVTTSTPSMLFALGMPMLIMTPFLVGQVKTQFAHSRARLTPQFFPAHLAVLSGILLTALLLYPFTLALLSGVEPLGLIALAVAIGVPALWGAQLNRFSLMLISMVVFYSLLTNWGVHWWMIDAPNHRGLHGLTVAAGAVLIIAWLWRLCHMLEEQFDYQNMNHMMLARRTGSEAIEQRRIVATQAGRQWLSAWVGDWWHDRLGGYFGGGRPGLVRVLRYGQGITPVEFQGLFFAAMMVCLGIFFSQFSLLAKSGATSGAMYFFVAFAMLLPGYMAGERLVQRRPRITSEMFLPLSRKQLIDGLLAASVRDSIVQWLMTNVALGVVVLTTNMELPVRTIVMFVLASTSITFATMGLSLRTSVWPSRLKRFVALYFSCFVLLAPMIVWSTLREKMGDAPLYVVAALLIGIGARLFYSARRAWLNVEFV